MPKGTRNFVFSFDEKRITHFGGMWLLRLFFQKLRLKKRLQDYVRCSRRDSTYRPSELLMALLAIIIMGLRRINKTTILQYNGAFLEMLGLGRFPDQTTLRRFLKRLEPDDIRRIARLHDRYRAFLFDLPKVRTSLVLDLDSVVIVVYGRKQGARVGYNPKKRGRRSYHPLLCFEANLHEFWHGSLRPGNTVAASGAVHFLRVCLAKIPPTVSRKRVRFRADAGFYGSRVIRFLEASGCGFVIVAHENAVIKRRARGCRFKLLRNGWEVGEFSEKVHHKAKQRNRFVVVRRPLPVDPDEAGQLRLFKDKKYAYHVFVTNLALAPWHVYLFYCPRAEVEKHIREFVYDYPLAKIPTDTWTANVAYFQLILFAWDLVHWFKRFCLPPEYLTKTLETIRTDFIVVPARLVCVKGKNMVRLPHDLHHQQEFVKAAQKIEGLRLPRSFRLPS
ncbi:MAG: IS1380 family transposase [Chloroflexota bacterium]